MLISKLSESEMANTHVIFNHIPKTGGTSLIDFYKTLYGEDACYRHRGRNVKTGKTSPAIESLSDETLLTYRFIAGHFPFSAGDRLKALGRKVVHITVVRDPIDRLISDYWFNREQGRPDLREATRSMSIDDYAFSKMADPASKMIDNGQCWYVGNERNFDAASRALNSSYLVACTNKQLDRMQVLLQRFYGQPQQAPIHSNRTKASKESGISPRVETMLRASLTDDMRLLEYVSAEFDKAESAFG